MEEIIAQDGYAGLTVVGITPDLTRKLHTKARDLTRHTTRNEIIFLRFLGTGMWDKGRVRDRQKCLQGYLNSITTGNPKRTEWGEIDPVRIEYYVRKQIRKMGGGDIK